MISVGQKINNRYIQTLFIIIYINKRCDTSVYFLTRMLLHPIYVLFWLNWLTEEDLLAGDDFTHGLSPPLYREFHSVNFTALIHIHR